MDDELADLFEKVKDEMGIVSVTDKGVATFADGTVVNFRPHESDFKDRDAWVKYLEERNQEMTVLLSLIAHSDGEYAYSMDDVHHAIYGEWTSTTGKIQ